MGNNTLYEVIIHATETPSNYSFKKTVVAKDLYGVEKWLTRNCKRFTITKIEIFFKIKCDFCGVYEKMEDVNYFKYEKINIYCWDCFQKHKNELLDLKQFLWREIK